eukprot:531665-Prymnesium_polylepis.1
MCTAAVTVYARHLPCHLPAIAAIASVLTAREPAVVTSEGVREQTLCVHSHFQRHQPMRSNKDSRDEREDGDEQQPHDHDRKERCVGAASLGRALLDLP